jgi:predicted transcriptional regulator
MAPPKMDRTARTRFEQDRAATSADDTIRVTDADEIVTVFDSLDDPDACAIMQALGDAALSAKEIAADCGLPMSTTYRKLNQLSEVGLLDEQTEISLDGKHASTYRRSFDSIEITITDDGFVLELSGCEPANISSL